MEGGCLQVVEESTEFSTVAIDNVLRKAYNPITDMKKSFTLRIADEDKKKLAKVARQDRTTISEVIREAIEVLLKKNKL